MTSLYDFYKSLIRGCLDLYCNANDDENWKNNTNDDDLDEEDYRSCYVDSLPDEDLGSVHLGFASDSEDGRDQWTEALQSPDTPCIKFYPLKY